MSFNEKRKGKSKGSDSSRKKPNHRIEAIKVTVEKKKQCNDKALQVVIDFSEGTISEDTLLENLKFINQEHYQDITEERSINKLCGYPLCAKALKNIPTKQYHISTTLNKVFDITDRKNFCSNLCYKASKFLKGQVSTSPLWLREDDPAPRFTLISHQSGGGMSGDEVDLGLSPVKLNVDDDLSTSSGLNDSTVTGNISNEDGIKNTHESLHNGSTSRESIVNESKTNCVDSNTFQESQCSLKKNDGSSDDILHESKTENQEDVINKASEKSPKSIKLDGYQASNTNVIPESITVDPAVTKEEKHLLESYTLSNNTQTVSSKKKSTKESSKRKPLSIKTKTATKKTNPISNVIFKIEQVLREWISIDSLCFVCGEEKIKELLAEKNTKNLPAFTQDIHFYERYLAICKKLNVLELEDTKIDAAYREENKKPLPDYDALKEEARQMEIKVRMFFKGDRVQFEEHEANGKVKTTDETVDVEPVLPLVDVHAQKAMRRRIVIDKLRRVLQDLQKSLGLRGFNLTEDLRILVGTFTLSAHNIMMKPPEWNLVSIAIIKMLSLRDNLLDQALNSSTANKHLTLLLMSYSLDAGYLDRLMVWLTDVEAVLQKP